MKDPWEPDQPLTIERAEALIRASFPSIDSSDLRFLGSGWEFDAYVTSDGWVVRFPRRVEAAGLFDKEGRVHRLVADVLPSDVAIPRVELVAASQPEFPFRFAAHRFIPGVPADDVDDRFLALLARQIGAALGGIHGIPEVAAREAGVEPDVDDEGGRGWFEKGLRELSTLRRSDPAIDRAAKWVAGVPVSSARFAGPLRFIHQDLSPEHVLVDPATGRLTGILDWTDAILGDAARDFVFLVAWRGWAFAEEVLRNYPHTVDPGFRDRLRFMARLLTPVWLGYAVARGTEVEKLTAWVHNAYAPDVGISKR
jgi:aminoglycoside phosphotransferase (APT) family kinase protein